MPNITTFISSDVERRITSNGEVSIYRAIRRALTLYSFFIRKDVRIRTLEADGRLGVVQIMDDDTTIFVEEDPVWQTQRR
jgi:transcription elongation factor